MSRVPSGPGNGEVVDVRLRGIDDNFTNTMNEGIQTMETFAERADAFGTRVLHSFELALGAVQNVLHRYNEALPRMDALISKAKLLDVDPKFLKGLRTQARLSGVGIGQLEKAITGVTASIGRAEMGNEKAIKAYNNLGLSWKKLVDLSPEKRVEAIANALHKMPPEKQLAALAAVIGGNTGAANKSAAALLPTFAKGAEGIKQMTAEASRFGVQWTASQQAAVDAANKARDQINQGIEGLEEQLVVGLSPAITQITNSFVDWLEQANKTGLILKFAEDLGEALKIAASWSQATLGYVDKILHGKDTNVVGNARDRSGLSASKLNKEFAGIARQGAQANYASKFLYESTGNFGISNEDAYFKNNYNDAQNKARSFIKDRMGVNTEQFEGAGAEDWISIATDLIQKKMDAEIAQRKPRAGEITGKENDASGRETTRKETLAAEKQARKDMQNDWKRINADFQAQEKRAGLEQKRDRAIERANEKIKSVAQRRADFENDKQNNFRARDVSFHAAERGTEEGYRAEHATGRADSTALQQLDTEKKIHEEEVKSRVALEKASISVQTMVDLMKAGINNTSLLPLGL